MSSVVMSATMSKAISAFSAELIRACASKYGFDGEEAMRDLSVSFASSEKKSKGKKEAAPKGASRKQPSIPLPFTGVVREDCCIGVKQNHGLYTQCFSAGGETGLCKGCAKQASKNASGEPDCGIISKRMMQGSEYRDAKGRGPVHYTKVMKKQKLTQEQVIAEATKFGIEIDASHFAVPEAQQKRGRPKKATTSDTESETSSATGEKKTRGRPKKAAKVVEVNETEDLFASLMQQAQSASPRPSKVQDDDASSISALDSESDSESKGSKKKAKKSKEESEEELAEKAAKFLAKEEAKEKKAQAQQEKALKLAEEKALKLAEKEKAQQEKAKKAAEKEKAQQEKEAEKLKKAQAQQEKSEKKTKETKKTKKAEEPVKPVEPVADLESEDEESDNEEPVVTVKKFEHQGVTYLRSSDGILYDAKSQEVVGKWNEQAGMIDVYNGDSEDSDEDSDSDDE